jgi:hypothetical protein
MESLTTRRETIVSGLAAALIASGCMQDSNRSKSMTGTVRGEGLSPDLIPFISQPEVSMAVVAVMTTQWTRHKDQDLDVESGPVTFQVRRAIHGDLPEGRSIEVQATRVLEPTARVRHNFDAWNTLSLDPGELMIFAARPGGKAGTWIGVAARQVSTPDAAEVNAVRRAYAIEHADGDIAAKGGMLHEALRSEQEILLFYALDHLRRNAAQQREAGTQVLANAIASAPPSEQTLELGRALTAAEFFRRSAGADRVNTMVVVSLVKALVQENDSGRRASWALLVSSCVLMDFTGDQAENGKIRSALIQSAEMPEAGWVVSTIASAESSATPDAKPLLGRLRRAWQTR